MCPTSAFSINLTDFYCAHWAHQAAYSISADTCRLYCCGEPTCSGWSFRSNDGWCALGNVDTQGCVYMGKGSGIVGEGRSAPVPIGPIPPANGPQSTNYNDDNWSDVIVPHDYVVQQIPSQNEEWSHGFRPRNISWYRKHFTLDENFANQTVWLEFDGVYRSSDMWLNGQLIGRHTSGYTSFRWRIDNLPGFSLGENILSVRIDPRADEGWWYEGAGIYRHTFLVSANRVHIARWGVYVPTTVVGKITSDEINGGFLADSYVKIYVDVESHYTTSSTVYFGAIILDPKNNSVYEGNSAKVTVGSNLKVTVVLDVGTLSNAALWDPTMPNLYQLVVQLYDTSGNVLDSSVTTFGFRKTEYDPNEGFFINGVPTKLHGVCNHQDFAGVGTGIPDRINEYRIHKLQSFGVNSWRMSHNPPNPDLLDSADRLGMLVWDENRFFGNFSRWESDLADMVLRDRNHPSIIFWSLCNEWGCEQYDINRTLDSGKNFRKILKTLDVTRPITGAWNGDLGTGVLWGSEVCDVMGINYNYQSYDPFHQTKPSIPLVSSESCSCVSDRNSMANSTEGLIGPFTAWPCIRDCWKPIGTRDFVMGSFDWTGFDYRGEESPTRWPTVNSHFGGIDLSGFPKDDMFYFKAQFLPDVPVVQIVPQDISTLGSTSVFSGDFCSGANAYIWKFGNSSSSGSLIQTGTDPSQCIIGANTFPATIGPCQPNNPNFLFFTDKYGQIYYNDKSSGKLCLDLYAQTGPQVGFFPCKESFGTNQIWKYLPNGGIQSQYNNVCIAVGSSLLVYTNGDSVDLLVNGIKVKSQNVPQYEAGNFLLLGNSAPSNITAVVSKNGKMWGSQTLVTPGNPVAITLTLEYPAVGTPIFSNGQDAAIYTASVVDKSGNIVISATNEVKFSIISGPGTILGTGNGNPSDHTPDQGPIRKVWYGYARVIIGTQNSQSAGNIVISASSPGLTSATVSIPTVPKMGVAYM